MFQEDKSPNAKLKEERDEQRSNQVTGEGGDVRGGRKTPRPAKARS